MRNHGGLAEILASHQAPAGFVRQGTGEVTTTTAQRKRFKAEADFIQRKKQNSVKTTKGGMELVAVGSQIEEALLCQRAFDGVPSALGNKDAMDYLRRAGHPIATMNPALHGGD